MRMPWTSRKVVRRCYSLTEIVRAHSLLEALAHSVGRYRFHGTPNVRTQLYNSYAISIAHLQFE